MYHITVILCQGFLLILPRIGFGRQLVCLCLFGTLKSTDLISSFLSCANQPLSNVTKDIKTSVYD